MANLKIYVDCKGCHCYYCSHQEEVGDGKWRCKLFGQMLEENPQMILEEEAWNIYRHKKFTRLRCISCTSAEIHERITTQWENMID